MAQSPAQLSVAPSIDDIASIGEDILDSLPDEIRNLVRDIPIVVKDWPEEQLLLELGVENALELTGLYCGTPIAERLSVSLPSSDPERIELYRQAILFEWCERGVQLYDVVFDVLTHEIGHHLGMDEEAVLRMEGRSVD